MDVLRKTNMSCTHIIKSLANTADVRQIKPLLSKHFFHPLKEISLTQCPRQLQHPDKKLKTAQSLWSTIWSWTPDTVGGLSDAASALLGGLRYVSGSSDTFTKCCLLLYISVFEGAGLQKKPSDKNKCAKPQLTRELEIHEKHQGGDSQEGNYRWIPSGQKPVQQMLKKAQNPIAGPERGVSLPSVTQAENSPSNITTPQHLPMTFNYFCIAISVPLLCHLDGLPSHCWLCWTNLKSPRPYVAPPTGCWHKKTSLTEHLLTESSYLNCSVWNSDWNDKQFQHISVLFYCWTFETSLQF